jgi:hypothetical protein
VNPTTAVLLLALSACGGVQQSSARVFSTTAREQVTSNSGALSVSVFEAADHPLARGVNSLRLDVVGGALVHVTPWMPAMGHGSATEPVLARDGSAYVLEGLVLAMPGRWELRCDLVHDGGDDHAVLTFDVD